jgi:hypothetical protein
MASTIDLVQRISTYEDCTGLPEGQRVVIDEKKGEMRFIVASDKLNREHKSRAYFAQRTGNGVALYTYQRTESGKLEAVQIDFLNPDKPNFPLDIPFSLPNICAKNFFSMWNDYSGVDEWLKSLDKR